MMKQNTKQLICAVSIGFALFTGVLQAADHGDAPTVGEAQGADAGDLHVFLHPNDNTQVALTGTTRGFMVPGEASNFSFFDEEIRDSSHIENTRDSSPEFFLDVNFNHVLRPVIDSKGRKVGDTGFVVPDLMGFKGVPRTARDALIAFRGKAPTDFVGANGKSHAPKGGDFGTGDCLHLETNAALLPNSGLGGGDNNGADFPNGSRLKHDATDTIVPPVNGIVDDNTRN